MHGYWSSLLLILSKKNLKANHNRSENARILVIVVINIVKEKSESKSQHIGDEGMSAPSCY